MSDDNLKKVKLKTFKPEKMSIQLNNVLAFDFEIIHDAENAVLNARTFFLFSKMNMKWNGDSTKDDFEKRLGHVNVYDEPYSSVTIMSHHILAN